MSGRSLRVAGMTNRLWSGDLAPVDRDERAGGVLRAGALWAAMACSLPMYLFASCLVALGMSVGAVLGSVLAGSLVVAAVAMGCGHAGVRYGIPFAVLARVAFGVVGATVPVALRLLVGCAWVGIVCWLGAEALFGAERLNAPFLRQTDVWAWFVWLLLLVALPLRRDWRRVAGIVLGACFLLVMALSLWFALQTRGIAVLADSPSLLPHRQWAQGPGVALGLTALLGLWLPIALGASDFGRGLRSQRDQAWSIGALPIAMVVFAGVVSTVTALAMARGARYWNPVLLAGGIARAMLAAGCLVVLAAIALLTARSACGWLSERMAEVMPTRISPAGGRWLVSVLAALWMPVRLVGSPESYLGGWLTGCAGLLAPIAAVVLVEYIALRRRWLHVDDLYQRDGLYEYNGGWHWKAFGAVGAGWLVTLVALFAPELERFRNGSVWLGTGVTVLLYWILRSGPPEVAMISPTPLLIPLAGFEGEGASS